MKMKKYKTIIGNHACATFIIAISMFKLKLNARQTLYYKEIKTHFSKYFKHLTFSFFTDVSFTHVHLKRGFLEN